MSAEMDVEGLLARLEGIASDVHSLSPYVVQQLVADSLSALVQQAKEIAAWKDRHHEASTSKAQYIARLNDCEAEVAALTCQLQEAEDMANVGRSLMEQIESNAESLRGWSPVADPAEVVVHLINQRDEAESRLQEAAEERDRLRKLDREAATHVESVIVLRTRFTGESPYVGWKGLGLALTEALDERDALKRVKERYGLALMMIREGCAQPEKVAREALAWEPPDAALNEGSKP